ncbi:MAG: threonine ammonia-lyase [Spirochaetales bacterium]|nr:threonine ammonia-lyase [Spirochaetales bacterium]
MPATEKLLSLQKEDFLGIQKKLSDQISHTACLFARTLSEICETEIFFKFENLQYTASFKERGALYKLMQLDENQKQKGVIAMSAGNHAQALAYHARRLGIPSTIVMPAATPFIKIHLTRQAGARVMLEGETLSQSEKEARRIAQEEDLTFVHPYDDEDVILGQSSALVEMLADIPSLDAILVPVGGGGLLAGTALAARALCPGLSVIGVEVENYASMSALLDGRTPDCGGATIAEGIAVKQPGQKTLAVTRALNLKVVTVNEASLETAVALLANIEKTVVEGAGAAGLAFLLEKPDALRGKKVGIVLSGGNIDSRILAAVLLRDLARQGRITRLRLEIADSPGALAEVAGRIGQEGGNIIDVSHQRIFAALSLKSAYLDIALETRDNTHRSAVIQSLKNSGYKVEILEALERLHPATAQI